MDSKRKSVKSKPKQRQAILRKISALLALTTDKGAGATEADNAHRMAVNLMRKHNVTEDELRRFENGGKPGERPGGLRKVVGAVGGLGVLVLGLAIFGDQDGPDAGRQLQEPDGVRSTVRALRADRESVVADNTVAGDRAPENRVAASERFTVPALGGDAAAPNSAAMVAEPTNRPKDPDASANTAAPSPEAALASMTRADILVRYNGDSQRQVSELEQSFREAKVDVKTRGVAFKISRTHVRYFSSEGRMAAYAAQALIQRSSPDGMVVELRDFSSFDPAPPPNTIEIWMASY